MDYKYEIHKIAEEIADKEYGCEYYDLPEELQHKVWMRAEVEIAERLQNDADNLRKEMQLSQGGTLRRWIKKCKKK